MKQNFQNSQLAIAVGVLFGLSIAPYSMVHAALPPDFTQEEQTFNEGEDWEAEVRANKYYENIIQSSDYIEMETKPVFEGSTFYYIGDVEKSVNNVTVSGARVGLGVFYTGYNSGANFGNLSVSGTENRRGLLGLYNRQYAYEQEEGPGITSSINVGKNATFIYSYASAMNYGNYSKLVDRGPDYKDQSKRYVFDYIGSGQGAEYLAFTSLSEIEARVNRALSESNSQNASVFYTSLPINVGVRGGVYVDAEGSSAGIALGDNSLFVLDKGVPVNFWSSEFGNSATAPVFSESDQDIEVSSGAKLYIYGLTGKTNEIVLISDTYEGAYTFWDPLNIYSDNSALSFTYKEGSDNRILVGTRTDPSVAFDGYMMSTAILDQATTQESALAKTLRSFLGQKPIIQLKSSEKKAIGAQVDASLSPAVVAGVYSTAIESTEDLIDTVFAHAASPRDEKRFSTYAAVTGGKTEIGQLAVGMHANKVKRDSYGIVVGADAEVAPHLRAGAAFSVSDGTTDSESFAISDDFRHYGFLAYLRYALGPATLSGFAGFSRLSSEVSDSVLNVNSTMDTDIYSAGVQGSVGLLFGDTVVYPFIGAEIHRMKTAGYEIIEGVDAVPVKTLTSVRVPVGMSWRKDYQTNWGLRLTPNATVAYVKAYGDKSVLSTTTALGASSTLSSDFIADHYLRAALGLEASMQDFYFGMKAHYLNGTQDREAYGIEGKAGYKF